MTKIWTFSDTHQEFVRDARYGGHPLTRFDPAPFIPDGTDVVVIPGDADAPLTEALAWIADRLPGMPVVYVPGNHDYFLEQGAVDRYTMADQMERGREMADRLGIHLLLDDVAVIDGTRFAGGTLWTDFGSVGYGSLAYKLAVAAGRDGMNDYKRIKRASSKYPGKLKRLRPEDTIAAHRKTRAFIERTLATPFPGPTVVVTHHAPHPESLEKPLDVLSWCYASQLRGILESPDAPEVWLHGHTHRPRDYAVGGTRVVCNPRGYWFDDDLDRDNGFDPALVVEVVPGRRFQPLPPNTVIHRGDGGDESIFEPYTRMGLR